jgi:uracil-DNA glycosylase
MTGFFSKKEIRSVNSPEIKSLGCHSCGLYQYVKSPKMEPYGNFKKGILNIGEAPGETEDTNGKPWQGKAGTLLRKTYRSLGIDLFEDCLNINAVSCRPMTDRGSNRTPTNHEIECCRVNVLKAIEQYKPKVIVLLGNIPIQSVIGHRWKKDLGGITKWRGWHIPDQDFKAWICPVFHPSFIMRSEAEELITVWEQDLDNIFSINDPVPVYREPNIQYIDDLSVLDKIPNGSSIAFDYETTGLKPYAKGHEIVSASIATNENEVYAFLMPKDEDQLNHLRKLLRNKLIKKMAANCKFEETWSYVRIGTRVKGWYWDSMLSAHELDNRSGITGLKFQVFVQFGVADYSSEVDKWLQAKDSKNANSLNRVNELIKTESGKMKLLKYNALDSIFEYRLSMKQMKQYDI